MVTARMAEEARGGLRRHLLILTLTLTLTLALTLALALALAPAPAPALALALALAPTPARARAPALTLTLQAQPILAGRSGARRLATAEEHLSSTSAWLSGRIGLGGGLATGGGDAVDAAPRASQRLLYSGRVVPTAAAAGGAGAPYKVGTRPPGSGLLAALVNAGKAWQMLPRR